MRQDHNSSSGHPLHTQSVVQEFIVNVLVLAKMMKF